MTLNGSLAGLVAITAGCDLVSPAGAAIIGIIAGIVVVLGIEFIDQKLKIDDPVGAIGVHGVCGALGTILTGLFAVDGGLLYGGGFAFLGTQILGVVVVAIYVAIVMWIVFILINKTTGLRVEASEEVTGLDSTEHGLVSSYADFMPLASVGVSEPDVVKREKAIPSGLTKEGAVITKVTVIFNPDKLDSLKNEMNGIGVTGMTVSNVVGCGLQKGLTDYYRGVKIKELSLLPKMQMDIVVSSVPVESVIEAANKALRTGHFGDGKIFIQEIENVVKISTGEEGYAALQDSLDKR
jgi:Amt family ammonium transporter